MIWIAPTVSITRSRPSRAAWLDCPDASEVETALRATSSTAAVISLTAVAAWSISLFCCCRPREASSVTALNSSAAEASCVAEPAMCWMVWRRLACMVDSALSNRAGSSLPSSSMVLLRLPAAMVSATSTALRSGVTMLRVNNQASSTVSNAATTETATTPVIAPS
ncbi:hypothetical protein PFLmoz3_03904 [Pseudomonas fluorescens]|uniref:Uncharacterized protein n=1 Tax=Pseudomonas fluorescens TaxID=294 RepID=A0A120G6Z9_PSEFL|nr:hypothetical protein PFLmoz3_03904 [Pseudomonas fluorescens]